MKFKHHAELTSIDSEALAEVSGGQVLAVNPYEAVGKSVLEYSQSHRGDEKGHHSGTIEQA